LPSLGRIIRRDQIPIACAEQLNSISRGFLPGGFPTPAIPARRPVSHGAGIRKPSHEATLGGALLYKPKDIWASTIAEQLQGSNWLI
jgi:hypothetical protein